MPRTSYALSASYTPVRAVAFLSMDVFRIGYRSPAASGKVVHERPRCFILVLDLPYTRFEMDTQVTGVMLATRSAVLKVKGCGYTDDTAVYIRSQYLRVLCRRWCHR